MSLMDFLDDFIFGPCNLIDRLEGLLRGVSYGDLGHQFAILRADKGGQFTLAEVEALLDHYGIPVYGRTHDAQCLYFHVKKRQARWAEYLLLHAGVTLQGPLFDPRNAGYVARHAPGWMPTAWADQQGDASTLGNADTARQSRWRQWLDL